MKPPYPSEDTVEELRNVQRKQKVYYDEGAHKLRDLSENETVYKQKGIRKWIPGIVINKDENPDIYVIRTEERVYRRNQIHIRPCKGK